MGRLYTIRSVGGAELWSGQAESMRDALEQAVRAGADLTFADLTFANLTFANLADANLTYANLARANLADANLARANLAGANLTGANLADANLARANLARADGIRIAASGTLLSYGWSLVAQGDDPPRLRYGCVSAPLAEWTEDRIAAECAKWEPERRDRYARALAALTAYCCAIEALDEGEVIP